MKMQKVFSRIRMSSIKSFLFSLLIVVLACSCSTHAKIKHKGAYIEIPEKEIKIGAIKKDAMKHIYQVDRKSVV